MSITKTKVCLEDLTSDFPWSSHSPLYTEFSKKIGQASSDNEKADLFFNLWLANRGKDFHCLLAIAKELSREAEENNNHYALGWYNFILGWLILDHDNDAQDAHQQRLFSIFKKSQEHFRAANYKSGLARAYNGEASALRQYGFFTEAFDKFLEALDIAEEIHDEELLHITSLNIGVVLQDLNQFEEALYFLEKGESYVFRSQTQLANHKNNLSIVYRYLGDLEKAEKVAQEALAASNEGLTKASALIQLGIIRRQQKKNEEAQELLRKSLNISSKENLPRFEALTLINLGEIAFDKKEYSLALKLSEEALKLAKKIQNKFVELHALLTISKIQAEFKEFELAYQGISQVREIEKEFFNEETINKMGIMKVQQNRKENIIYRDLYDRIKAITKIGQTITANFDIQAIGITITNHINSLMPTDKVIIASYEVHSSNLNCHVFVQEEEGKIASSTGPLSKNCLLVKRTCQKQESIILNNIDLELKEKNFNLDQQIFGKDTKSLICTPLVLGEKTIGFLSVQRNEIDIYDHHHLDILKALAAYTAIALENSKLFFDVKELSLTDPLTGIANRRHSLEMGVQEFDKSKRYGTPLTVIIADIDYFKRINDNFGHAAGDLILKELASYFKKASRNSDILGRLGGEEFLFILSNSPLENALALAERLRKSIEELEFNFLDHKIKITVSFGVASIEKEDLAIEDTIKRADEALYLAKNAGRNTVGKIGSSYQC